MSHLPIMTIARTRIIRSIGFALAVFWMLQSPAASEDAPESPAEFPGRIEALNSYDVSNLIDGVITKVHFKPGQFVEVGDVLFTIESGSYELALKTQRLQTVKAEAALNSARQDFERIKTLKDRGSATEVQMLKAEVGLALGDALVEQAKAELKAAETNLENTFIRAPISGVVSRSRVNPGSYVEKGDPPLSSIDQMDPVRLSYMIPYVERIGQLAIDDLRSPSKLLATITLQIKISETWTYSETTSPDYVSSRVDAASGTLTIWAELANPNFHLRPGMRVSVLPMRRDQ